MPYRVASICACALLGACGRIDFGPLARGDGGTGGDAGDAPLAIGHDEDGDGIPDSADPCPHIAGDTADTDGDGVGDACDPHPTTPGDAIAGFWTLQPGDNPFDQTNTLVQEPDALRFTGTTAGFGMNRVVTSGAIDLGFVIHGLVGTGQHQVASGINGGTPYYFVELNENQGGKEFQLVSYDSTNGYVTINGQTTNGMHAGTGFLRYQFDATAQTFTARGGWTGELYDAVGPTPGYSGGQSFSFALNGLDVSLRYVILISSP